MDPPHIRNNVSGLGSRRGAALWHAFATRRRAPEAGLYTRSRRSHFVFGGTRQISARPAPFAVLLRAARMRVCNRQLMRA